MMFIQTIDRSVGNFLYLLSGRSTTIDLVFKASAQYLIYLVPVILIWLWFTGRRKVAFLSAIAGIVAWQGVNSIIGAFYFRHRPFDRPIAPVKELLFHRPDKSFPSDHAAMCFALALMCWYEGERWLALVFFLIGLINGLARVATGLHYPTDIVGAIPSALIAVGLVVLFRRVIVESVLPVVESLLKRIRLA